MQGSDGKLIYNIGQMKEEASPKVKGSSAENGNGPRGFASSEDSLAEQDEEVKQRFSESEEEENSADVVPWEIPEKEAQERGYPVLNGQQVIPFKTWVHAFDVNEKTGEAYDNYGLVVGRTENGLLVWFENKNQKGKDGKNLIRTVKMSLDEVEAVQGASPDAGW